MRSLCQKCLYVLLITIYSESIIMFFAKGGYIFGSVSLSVCVLVSNITQKVMNRLQ